MTTFCNKYSYFMSVNFFVIVLLMARNIFPLFMPLLNKKTFKKNILFFVFYFFLVLLLCPF